jgi:hypothetical protein
MAEPFREQVMAAFATRLATIVAGDVDYSGRVVTYLSSPSLVTRALLWITQYDQPLAPPDMATQLDAGPVLGVVRGSGSLFSRIEHVPDSRGAVAGFAHEMHLTVWGYCKGDALDSASKKIERLWADQINAILVEPRFAGLVADSTPDGPLDTDDGVMEPLAYFAQDWLVKG